MQSSTYNSLFAAVHQQRNLSNITNNLANVNTTGYKKEKLGFKDIFDQIHTMYRDPCISLEGKPFQPAPPMVVQCMLDQEGVDFSQGSMMQTGNPLDLAIQGPGFFKVQTEDGVRYTRSGNFKLSTEGEIVNPSGHAVLGDGGPMVIPEGTREILLGDDGRVLADGQEIGVLDLTGVNDPNLLEKQGETLLRPVPDADLQEVPFEGELVQGYLEGANIEVVEEMVNMISTLRSFEAYQKVMRSSDELDKKVINEVGSFR